MKKCILVYLFIYLAYMLKRERENDKGNFFIVHLITKGTTRNSTFWHNFFGHEYNFVSKYDFGKQNLILLQKFVSKILIECEMRPNYL